MGRWPLGADDTHVSASCSRGALSRRPTSNQDGRYGRIAAMFRAGCSGLTHRAMSRARRAVAHGRGCSRYLQRAPRPKTSKTPPTRRCEASSLPALPGRCRRECSVCCRMTGVYLFVREIGVDGVQPARRRSQCMRQIQLADHRRCDLEP